MLYNTIINPKNMEKISIYSKTGKEILQNFIFLSSLFDFRANTPLPSPYSSCFSITILHLLTKEKLKEAFTKGET